MTVVGTRVRPEVVMIRKVIILLLAVSLVWFSFCISFIAFIPIPVAPFPRPKRFITILLPIRFRHLVLSFISGKRCFRRGLMKLVILVKRPLSSYIFIIPSQRQIMGSIFRMRSKLSLQAFRITKSVLIPLLNP